MYVSFTSWKTRWHWLTSFHFWSQWFPTIMQQTNGKTLNYNKINN
jgi:membrane-bound metal-dependent hydrolase YbcI (DUF457 family)